MRKICVELSERGISQAIKELNNYKLWVESKTALLIERLAIIGAQEASIRFASAIYDGDNDSKIAVEPWGNGWRIVARGESVCFIEFGTGAYHNGGEPYPLPRPAGVVGIGEYGKGFGKRQGWVYEGNPGTNGKELGNGKVLTHGNPAQMPMWYAEQEMLNVATQIAREVFAS